MSTSMISLQLRVAKCARGSSDASVSTVQRSRDPSSCFLVSTNAEAAISHFLSATHFSATRTEQRSVRLAAQSASLKKCVALRKWEIAVYGFVLTRKKLEGSRLRCTVLTD